MEDLVILGGGLNGAVVFFALVGLILMSFVVMLVKQYKRCPSNRVLVVYGKIAGERSARCIHGGGIFVVPLIQDYEYLSLKPLAIDIDLTGALSLNNIRVNVPSTFTVGISTESPIMANAAERLLGLLEQQISSQAKDIILGQLRLVVATLSIEEINQDREKFLQLINENVGIELNKIGLEVINVNITDITDNSGYIKAIGQKAAALAINKAKVEVAEQEKMGSIGEATANRDKEVQVAEQHAQAQMGTKKAESEQRIALAKYNAEGVTGEAAADREQEIAIAEEESRREQGRKEAELLQRVKVATLESQAIEGENESQGKIADSNAVLAERKATARQKAEVAQANALKIILDAEKEQELARLEKEEIVQQQISKKKVEIDADAEGERIRRVAKGEADSILFKYQAEAEGLRKVLDAKAEGYKSLINACGNSTDLAPTLLMIEEMPNIVKEQVKAISNLKIDKITVWDNGAGSSNGEKGGSTANFLSSLMGSLPAWHELANQAGIELPAALGSIIKESKQPSHAKKHAASAKKTEDLEDQTKS